MYIVCDSTSAGQCMYDRIYSIVLRLLPHHFSFAHFLQLVFYLQNELYFAKKLYLNIYLLYKQKVYIINYDFLTQTCSLFMCVFELVDIAFLSFWCNYCTPSCFLH
ncbi:hypothetical protein GDO81_003248 [Engystomops pustulosus]|uniref:Uncharacterized protein n=1 Tax=Engystomops pustulosus TaxID=76066 RepID=A0AAV6ZUW2_ENGPU|nr:hypothetical protein GDO81_003248 [Engystomops pustulosus]